MELAQRQATAADGQGLLSDLVAWARSLAARRAVYVRTVNELSSLTPRALADIGIGRADIRAVARDVARAA